MATSDRADVRRLTLVIKIRTLVLSNPSTLNSLLINFLNQLRNIIPHLRKLSLQLFILIPQKLLLLFIISEFLVYIFSPGHGGQFGFGLEKVKFYLFEWVGWLPSASIQ